MFSKAENPILKPLPRSDSSDIPGFPERQPEVSSRPLPSPEPQVAVNTAPPLQKIERKKKELPVPGSALPEPTNETTSAVKGLKTVFWGPKVPTLTDEEKASPKPVKAVPEASGVPPLTKIERPKKTKTLEGAPVVKAEEPKIIPKKKVIDLPPPPAAPVIVAPEPEKVKTPIQLPLVGWVPKPVSLQGLGTLVNTSGEVKGVPLEKPTSYLYSIFGKSDESTEYDHYGIFTTEMIEAIRYTSSDSFVDKLFLLMKQIYEENYIPSLASNVRDRYLTGHFSLATTTRIPNVRLGITVRDDGRNIGGSEISRFARYSLLAVKHAVNTKGKLNLVRLPISSID